MDWARDLWQFLHVVSFAYPERPSAEVQSAARAFLGAVAATMVCSYPCGEHFARVLATKPPAVGSRDAFARWMYDVHNDVNARLSKAAFAWEDAVAIYAHMRPEAWGPRAWNALHHITFAAPKTVPDAKKRQYETLFAELQHLLPSQNARAVYRDGLALYPLDASRRETLAAWLVQVHNLVNMLLFKPTLLYAEVRAKYLLRAPSCGVDLRRA